MSAWRVGVEAGGEVSAAAPPAAAAVDAADEADGGFSASQSTEAEPPGKEGHDKLKATVDRITKWVPGDAIALYVAAVTAFSAAANARPSIVLLAVFIALTAAIVLLGEFAATGEIPRKSWLAAVLATIAFAIWSLTVPFSGWQRLDWVHDNQAAVAVVAAILALLFSLGAEGTTKRMGKKPKKA